MPQTTSLVSGPLTRGIVVFTIPLLIGNLFQQMYSFTDTAVVGRLIGVQALAAVGASGGLLWLLLGFTFGVSSGLAIPVARAFGAGDMTRLRRCVAAGLVVAGSVALIITVVGVLGGRFFLRVLNTPAELIPISSTFLIVSFGGSAISVAYNFLACVIRAVGDSRTPLIFLIVSCVLNVGLEFLFVAGFQWGVAGSASATLVAQFVSMVSCLILVATKMPMLRVRRGDFHFLGKQLLESAKLGLAMGFQSCIIAVGALILQYCINGLGAGAVAAFTAAGRVDQIATIPMNTFGLALATFAAQNRGAQQWQRIRAGVFRMIFLVGAVAIVLGAVVVSCGYRIVGLLIGPGQPGLVVMAHHYLLVNGSLYTLLALLCVLRNSLQGLGLTVIPTIGGIMELTFRTIAGFILIARFGFWGACLAAPLAWTGSLIPIICTWFVQNRRLRRRADLVQVTMDRS